jgi:tetratricopeptide (TPR) repeat protein
VRIRLLLFLLAALAATPGAAQEARVAALRQAAASIDHSDLPDAARILQHLLDQKPDDAVALNLMGVVRMRESQPEAAEKLFRQAIDKGPRLPGPHVNLALLLAASRPFEAITELGEALKRAPGDAQAQAALRAIAEKAALQAVKAGDKERALSLVLHARRELPRDPEMLYKFSLVAMESGLFPDAKAALDEALRLRPDYPDASYALARAYLGEGKAAQAEEQLRKYLIARPTDASAQYGLGYVLMSEQKLDEARVSFERSLAARPDQTESLFQLGQIALQKGDPAAATGYFQRVLERDPDHAGALTEKAVFAYRAGKYTDASANLERAIRSAPAYQKAHYYYALTLAKLGNKAESEKQFRIATGLQRKTEPARRLAVLPE